MLRSDHAIFCTISLKSETNDTTSHTGIEPLSLSGFLDKTTGLFQSMNYAPTFPTGFEPLSLSSSSNKTNGLFQCMDYITNDFPAITTSSFLQRYVPKNASIAHVSATTATTNATLTQVPATRSATMNTPKYQLDKCNATRAQNKTRSPSILHPAKKVANYVTTRNLLPFFVQNDLAITIANSLQMIVEYLLLPRDFECPAIMMVTHAEYSLQLIVESLILLRNKDNSETMASSLLHFCVKDAPAIMMATHANYSLQLIVESLFTGAKQVASATIPNKSFKLIDVSKTSVHFRKD
jgi:hypothetical protein